ncbi:MAG: glycosyltransferase family A protein [Polaribacter sp.]|uniref:glycosyltransferase family 2 protein n=1 Tax=Polaribacter sp. TaxID=1920175 RepID=UPI0032655D69
MTPKVSVIVSTYNRLDYLKKTLFSVLNQTFQDFEILVVDDGTKGNLNEKWCEQFERINYIKIPHSGTPCKTRNLGIKKAKGKYVAFLDDDDLWVSNRLELMVNVLDNNPDFGLVHAYCSLIDEDDNDLNQIVGKPRNKKDKHGDVRDRMMGNWTISDYPLIRKEILSMVGYFNEDMIAAGEDVEFWARTSFFTKFYFLNLPLTKYRIHSKSNSKKNEKKYFDLNLKLKLFLDDFLERKVISKKDYTKLINKLVQNQIKKLKTNYFKTLIILHKLNFLWFLKYKNIKLLIFILVKK